MKRKYFTGAAILLFIVLGISYYYRAGLSANVPATDAGVNAQTISTPPHIDDASDPQSVTGSASAQAAKDAAQAQQSDQNTQNNRVYNGNKSACRPRHRVAARRKPACATVKKEECENIPVFTPEVITTTTGHTTPVVLNVQVVQEHAGNYPQTVTHAVNSRMDHEQHHVSAFSGGIEGGINVDGFYSSRVNNIMTTGFHIGFIGNIDMGDNFAIQPSLRYIGKGNKVQSELDVNQNERLSLHYVELPLNFVYKFGHPGNARFMIGAGPYLAYLAGKEDRFHDGDFASESPNPPAPLFPTANILTWDWGAGGFLGVTTPEGIFVKAGTEVGLVNLIKNPLTAHYDYNRNFSFLVTAGYLFGGHK